MTSQIQERLNRERPHIVHAYKYRHASISQIARTYKFSRSTLSRAFDEWKVKRVKENADSICERIIDMYYSGMLFEDLMKYTRWSKRTLQNKLYWYRAERGLPPKSKSNINILMADTDTVMQLLETEPRYIVAQKYGVRTDTMMRHLEHAGLVPPILNLSKCSITLSSLTQGSWKDIEEDTIVTVHNRPKFVLSPYIKE